MPITKVEYLDDRAKVHYRLKKLSGQPGVDTFMDIFYKDIDGLPPIPADNPGAGSCNTVRIVVGRTGKKFALIFCSNMENPVGPKEENVFGAYRA